MATDPNELQDKALCSGRPFETETTLGDSKGRKNALYWRPLGPLLEITLYPLLWGQTRLTFGRRDRDAFIVGWDYPDHQSGWRAAEAWNGTGKPPHNPIRKVEMDAKRRVKELEI